MNKVKVNGKDEMKVKTKGNNLTRNDKNEGKKRKEFNNLII